MIDSLPENIVESIINQAKEEAYTLLSNKEKGMFDIFHEDELYQIDLICDISGEKHILHDEYCISEEICFSNVDITVDFVHSDPEFSTELKKSISETIESEVEEYLIA